MFNKNIFHICCIATMLMGVVHPSVVDAQPRYATLQVPVYGNIVETEMPLEWSHKPAYQKTSGRSYILELLPKGQTLTAWQEMITISGNKGAVFSPKDTFATFQRQHEFFCAKNNVATRVYQETPNVYIALLMCGGIADQFAGLAGLKKGQGEMALYKIEKRDGNLYLIFKSWRGKSFNAQINN